MQVFWKLAFTLMSVSPVLGNGNLVDTYISTPGGDASFICFSSSAVGVEWLVNGTLLENLNPNNVTTEFVEGIGGALILTNLPVGYNMTRITCKVSEIFSVFNSTSLLLLQGLLSAVGSLTITVQDSAISLTWTAPFTLDIQGVDPDITYCVCVVNSTSLSTLHSECEITEVEYEYPIPPDSACHMYMFTVTPVNVVGNGTSSTLTTSVTESPQVNGVTVSMSDPPTPDASKVLTYFITMSAGVCSGELMFVDLDTGEIITLGNKELTIAENNITFTNEQLKVNHRYNVTVRASNSAGSTPSYITISTHDILNATTTETDDVAIVITTLYSVDSNARGALFDFVFIDDNGDVDFSKSVLLALDRNTSLHHTLPFNLYPGQYRVFVYDIESDGTLSNGVDYPAVTGKVFTSGICQGFISQIECFDCTITVSSGLILAECTPINSALVTGFQMIAQSSNSSQVHVLYTNQSMDLQTPVTVEVEESGTYQVTIFAMREGMGIVGSYVGYTGQVQVMVGDVIASYTTDSTGISTNTKETTISTLVILTWTCAGLGTALVLTFIVMGGVIIVLCYKTRSLKMKVKSSDDHDTEPKSVLGTEELTVIQESQLYEEIGDITSTGNAGVSSSAPGTGTAAVNVRAQYEYEEVKPVGSGVAKSSGSYDITLCSAYGVSLNQDGK